MYKLKEIYSGLLIVVSGVFLLTVYAPLELYLTNMNNFWFDIRALLPIVFSLFVLMLFISIFILLILYCINPSLYNFLYMVDLLYI